MVDYIRHIINEFKGRGFTEEQIESAIRKFEEAGEIKTLQYLKHDRLMADEAAAELLGGIKKELLKIKRESVIRGMVWILFFSVVGVLAWKAHGYWIAYTCFAITAIKIFATIRYFITGR